jgi:hypothetical protein
MTSTDNAVEGSDATKKTQHRWLSQSYCPPPNDWHGAAHLIGIDPDYRLHVSERLLGQNDGPMSDALKGLDGVTIHLPARLKDRPDRNRLALAVRAVHRFTVWRS